MLAIFGIGVMEMVVLAAGFICLGAIGGIIAIVVMLATRKDR